MATNDSQWRVYKQEYLCNTLNSICRWCCSAACCPWPPPPSSWSSSPWTSRRSVSQWLTAQCAVLYINVTNLLAGFGCGAGGVADPDPGLHHHIPLPTGSHQLEYYRLQYSRFITVWTVLAVLHGNEFRLLGSGHARLRQNFVFRTGFEQLQYTKVGQTEKVWMYYHEETVSYTPCDSFKFFRWNNIWKCFLY